MTDTPSNPCLAALDEQIADVQRAHGRIEAELELQAGILGALHAARVRAIELLAAETPPQKQRARRGSVEAAFLGALGTSPMAIDDLVRQTGCERKSLVNVGAKLREAGKVTHSAATGVYALVAAERKDAAE